MKLIIFLNGFGLATAFNPNLSLHYNIGGGFMFVLTGFIFLANNGLKDE